MPISKVHSSLRGNNFGSCGKLVNYLDKENLEIDRLVSKTNDIAKITQLLKRKNDFFSHTENNVSQIDVRHNIDSNKRKLSKNDAKFFGPTISFSELVNLNLTLFLIKQQKVEL